MSRHYSHRARSSRDRERAKQAKRKLLPLSREQIDAMSIEYHTALAALRAGEGTERGVCVLLQMVILTGFIGDLRSDPINLPLLQQMDADLVAAFDRGRKTGAWFFDESVADLCAALLTHHDQQLKTAPLVLLQEAINQLERFKRGEYDGHA